MSDTAIDAREVGRYVCELHYDECPEDPREMRDCLGSLAGNSDRARSTICDTAPYTDAGSAYRDLRAIHGPLLAIPLRVTDGYHGTDVDECDWADADAIYYMPLAALEVEYLQHGYSWVDALKYAREVLRGELSELEAWCHGEVYGFVVRDTRTDEVVDSCWGFYGETDYPMSEAESVARWHEYRDACIWAALPAWVQESVLIREEVNA